MKRLLIIGHARHGKDTLAEFLNELYGYAFISSSQAAADIFIYDALKDIYGYKTPVECFEDRVNHREEWYNLICEYNLHDKARLAKKILSTADIYVGMRDDAEIDECVRQGVFDMIVGVYNPYKSEEHKGSFNINIWKRSHLIISNAGTLQDFKNKVIKLSPLFYDHSKNSLPQGLQKHIQDPARTIQSPDLQTRKTA